MTGRPARWTIIRDTSPLRGPTDADVLGAVVAADRAEARRIGARVFGVAVVAIASRVWSASNRPATTGRTTR